jgi:N-acylneuraminate cytidylyltransferase
MEKDNIKELNILGLVPARGSSKGIPRKNIHMLAGKPLLAYSIQHGKDSEYVSRVVCSTEDDEIAEAARKWGAEVPFKRPDVYSADYANDAGFTKHAIEWLRDNDNWMADIVTILRPTNPTRNHKDIDKSIELIARNDDAHSVIGVVKPSKSPYKMWKRSTTKFMVPLLTSEVFEQYNSARQLLPEVLAPSGYIHVVRADVVLRDTSVVGYKVMPYEMEIESMIDIDSEEDFKKAEKYFAKISKKEEN